MMKVTAYRPADPECGYRAGAGKGIGALGNGKTQKTAGGAV